MWSWAVRQPFHLDGPGLEIPDHQPRLDGLVGRDHGEHGPLHPPPLHQGVALEAGGVEDVRGRVGHIGVEIPLPEVATDRRE
jgi:hypothetical protein